MSEHLLPLTHEQDPEILKFLGYGQEKKSSDAVTRSLGCTLRSCPWKSQTGSGTRNNPGWECGHCRYVPSSPYSHSPSTVTAQTELLENLPELPWSRQKILLHSLPKLLPYLDFCFSNWCTIDHYKWTITMEALNMAHSALSWAWKLTKVT